MRRQYMEDFRAERALDLASMAVQCQCSQKLLEMLEARDGEVTHPNLARRIARAYHLNRSQYRSLLPVNHRPGAEYDPDRYRCDGVPQLWQRAVKAE